MAPRGAMDKSFYMKGLSMSSLRQNWSLVPLFTFLGIGALAGAGYLLRLAVKAPDVSWAHGSNPESWGKLPPTYQYKFYSPSLDYKDLKAHPEKPEL